MGVAECPVRSQNKWNDAERKILFEPTSFCFSSFLFVMTTAWQNKVSTRNLLMTAENRSCKIKLMKLSTRKHRLAWKK